jgi:LPS export ABC transporter protein LptC
MGLMSESGSPRGVQRVRGWLLGALAAIVLLVAGLFVFGRSGRVEEEAPPPTTDGADIAEMLLASEGWEYEVSKEGRPVFHIRGERMLSDSDDNVVLEGVGLTLYREDGDSWDVECDRGTYNRETQEALLRGNVRVVSSTGLKLYAEGIVLERGGRQIRSTSDIRFEYQDLYVGRADALSVNLHSSVYFLDRKVEIDSLPSAPIPSSLRCNRLVFEGRRNLVRALGAVRLAHGGSWLRARRLGAYLTADRSEIEFIRARGVHAATSRVQPDGMRQTLGASGGRVSVVFDPQTRVVREFELEGGSDSRIAQVSIEDSTGIVREVDAAYIVGHDMTRDIQRFAAWEPVAFREFFSFARDSVTSWACGDRTHVTLESGQLTEMKLDGNAELWRDGVFAKGRTIDFAAARGSTSLEGDPARVLARRGELEAPVIVQIHYSGEIQGHGGIRGRMNRARGALAGGEEGPIQVESEEIVWSETPEALTLRGGVRVWQDQQLLIADEISESVAAERLEARGGVRSVYTPPAEGEDETGSPTDEGERPLGDGEPIEVTADRAVYDRPNRLVTYTGGSRATQGPRSIRGEELELLLSEDGEAEQVECRIDVVIEDRENRRTVKGDLAVYRPDTGEVRISGERVTLRAEDGTRMEGPVLIYDFEDGRARIESEDLLAIDPPLEGAR